MWTVATPDVFNAWFQALGDEERAEIEAKVNLLEVFGPALGRPHADTLNGSRYRNMKEWRADTADHTLRIAFAFDPSRSAVLLVGGPLGWRSSWLAETNAAERSGRSTGN